MENAQIPFDAEEHAFELGQREVLEQIAGGVSLAHVLEAIVALIEGQQAGMVCSLLLLDAEHGTLQHGAAPNLPAAFVRSIDGSAIGPAAGSCGAAAFLRERVIIEDIATHPNWAPYRHLALPFGLRASWSSPIFSASGDVLGTFAMYFRELRGPRAREMHWVARATHLASIAIMRDRAELERRRMEEAVRHSERLRALAYNAVTDVLFYVGVTPEGSFRFLSVNPSFLKATGLSEDRVVDRLVQEVIPPASASAVLAYYVQAIREKRTVCWVEVSPYPAGVKHGEVSITPIFDDDGVCTRLVGAVHDITQHVEAQARIAAQAALLDSARDAILVRELDGRIRYWNKGAERLYGWTAEEAVGSSAPTLLHRDPLAYERAQRSVIEHDAWLGELEPMTKAGKQLTVEASWTLLRDDHGAPSAVFAISSDVTRKKELEQQVMRAQRMESLGTLAGGIAHDFNNLLTAIIGNTTIALSQLTPSHPLRERLLDIQEASGRAVALVRRILTFSRHEEPERRLIAVDAVVLEALKLVRVGLPASIEIVTQLETDTPKVLADPTQLHQIVMNLATNAAQAMADRSGVLTVRVQRVIVDAQLRRAALDLHEGEYALLTIADQGCGIDAATLERIFDPFFTTKQAGEGTGLGLSVVHGIVKNHRGGIVVHSRVGEGTEFQIYLPAAGHE